MPQAFHSWLDYFDFCYSVKHSARFIHDKKVLSFLNTLYTTSKNRIRIVKAGALVWRAQIGSIQYEREQDGSTWEDEIPFGSDRMKPLRHSAHEGRANPKGIPCLYVASNKETAMAEVRPWIGLNLSVAALKIQRDINLVDFSVGHDAGFPLFFDEPTPKQRTEAVWKMVDQAFSKPVTSDEKSADYVPTQVIAEFFKQKGLDGVVYKSSLDEVGYNLALFDLTCAEVTHCALYPVRSVKFEFDDARNGYQVNAKHGSED
ncbi:MAG: hypothetical protein CTY34_12810 [Methylobacter sp.]|nr:MAG: hypothetical protein CTY34_12810 [Methylobacter sp.]PPD21506.1 MAG: hypothetical protein CTY24_07590 [Methylobacter sp.]